MSQKQSDNKRSRRDVLKNTGAAAAAGVAGLTAVSGTASAKHYCDNYKYACIDEHWIDFYCDGHDYVCDGWACGYYYWDCTCEGWLGTMYWFRVRDGWCEDLGPIGGWDYYVYTGEF